MESTAGLPGQKQSAGEPMWGEEGPGMAGQPESGGQSREQLRLPPHCPEPALRKLLFQARWVFWADPWFLASSFIKTQVPGGFPGGSVVKNLPANAGDTGLIPGSGRSLEEKMATHSSILAWEIPRIDKPGRLRSVGFQRVRHDLASKQQLVLEAGSAPIAEFPALMLL